MALTFVFADWNSSTTGNCQFGFTPSTTSVNIHINDPATIVNVNGPGGSCDFINLAPSTPYTVVITSFPDNGTMSSSFKTPAGPPPPPPPPQPPGNVVGFTATPFYPPPYVHLSWNAASGATSYEIHYGKSAGYYDKVFNTGNTNTTADITDIIAGVNYYFYVYGVNADGLSPSASEVLHAVAGPGRPNDFAWAYTNVSAGQPCGMNHNDWNNLTAKISDFRTYKGLYQYGFTTAPVGIFEAYFYRQAVNAINEMNPLINVPLLHYTGDTVTANDIDRLRVALNSLS